MAQTVATGADLAAPVAGLCAMAQEPVVHPAPRDRPPACVDEH